MRAFKAEQTKYVCPRCHTTLAKLTDIESGETIGWVCRQGHEFDADSPDINAIILADALLP